jgi:cysteine-rich repeat protein
VKADVDACQATVAFALTGLCGNGSLNAGEQCDDGNNISGDGCSALCVNESTLVYQQDFEALNASSPTALGTDGWLVGANVFAGLPPGGAFLYNYFAFPAPNGGPAFSAVATGEGGVPQGAQQLSIYSDYNNGDHANGNTIEANVFRQITLGAGDVGKVFTFQFDHKLGNLNNLGDPNCPYPVAGPFLGTPCANTALAFIKVFNPVFTLLDFPTADMTSITATWGTNSVTTVPIPAGAVGGVLQFGFLNKASLYQPSGIFYDNVTLSSLP